MNAFVKTTKGKFPNPNFYSAWKGFTELGYDVITFEDEDLNDGINFRLITSSTPVFAGVAVFRDILNAKGVYYKSIDTYPESLKPFLNRNVTKTTLGEFRKLWEKDENNLPKKFIKPVEQKKFTGKVISSILDWIPLVSVSNDTEIYVSDVVEFLSEFRVYIQDQEILGGKHYNGDWLKVIDVDVVKNAIKSYRPQPIAYALDFGITSDGKTTMVEANDATSLGNYGLPPKKYAAMLEARWHEIMSDI